MRKATAISVGLHAAVLLWATLSFSGKTFDVTPAESLPVDLVSEKDFSQMTKGVKDAPKIEMPKPKPLAEKKAEEPPKPIEEAKPKITEKKEVQAAKETSPPPEPQKAQPDPIAEKIKQQDDPKQTKLDQPLPPKKPPPKPQPKFEPDKIAALLDKRDPQRVAAAGPELHEASLGAANGTAAQLSQSEIDALRARLRQCWNPPVGAADVAKLYVVFRVLFKRDGTLQSNPVLVEAPPSQVGPVLAESAKRALLQCQPYTMLKPEHYDQWKDMQITFDPREMFGG